MGIWLIMVVNFISFSFLVIEYIFLQAEGTEQVQKEKLNMKEKQNYSSSKFPSEMGEERSKNTTGTFKMRGI